MSWNTHIPKFRRFVLQNFPFIEEDFDALTDYELICKVIEYLNKVITSQNEVVAEVESFETNITNSFNDLEGLFIDLKSFVDNYFDNLDVQEEINNKLDAMVEDGTLQEIITTYIQSNVAWCFDSVADMKAATNLINGSYAKTLGYYTPNDGGGAEYKITNTESNTDYQESLNDDLFATLIIPNGILNVKTLGAKSDPNFDNTSILNTAMNYIDKYSIYFPYGFYRTANLFIKDISSNVKIYGDNANIKLLDNVIVQDGQRLFSMRCENSVNIVIEMSGLNIDMNYTNNHSVIDQTGDPWALQHCHAIFVYGNLNSNIEVLMHDLTFNDLIADGINLGGDSTHIVNKAIINNIISQNRTATRSDVCISCDFDSLNCSNMILDRFEIETNSTRSNTKRTVLLDNLDINDRLDLDVNNNDGENVGYVTNTRVGSYLNSNIENMTYTNCNFKLDRYVRVLGKKLQFINCDFSTKNGTEFLTYSESNISYIYCTPNDLDIMFKDCNIKYNNTVLTYTEENQATFIRYGDYCPRIEFDNCNIDISSRLLYYRGGDTYINNCTFKTSNANIPTFCQFRSGIAHDTTNIYLKNNKSSTGAYLSMVPYSGVANIYENNPEWPIGKVLNWTRFDKLTSFNGGTSDVVTVKEFTEFMNNDVPSTGMWIKGQRIKNSVPSTSFMWVCTANGSFESGTAPTFAAVSL